MNRVKWLLLVILMLLLALLLKVNCWNLVCTHHELIISDYEHFGRNSSQFTFVSDAHSTTSWLDHIICSFNLFIILSDLCILDKLPSSDHLPTGCKLCFDLDTCM